MPGSSNLLGSLQGLIGERNLNIAALDYSALSKIENELINMREIMPIEWDLPVTDDLSLGEVFTRQIGKFYYNLLLKNAHFPYMLRVSPSGESYSYSRTTALDASRKMIEHYHGLRHSAQGELLICDLMDFQVFAAAIVIVINLLFTTTQSNDYQRKEDWALIQALSQTLHRQARAMTCTVAKQAAELLDYLNAAGHDLYTRDEPVVAVIPYLEECVSVTQENINPPALEIMILRYPLILSSLALRLSHLMDLIWVDTIEATAS
ncbi:hypothetical protein BDV12DRAFT_202240 [Aspergillus spectabilis]